MSKIFNIIYKIKVTMHIFLVRQNYPTCEGFCGPCFSIGYRQRQNTAYCDDSMNWIKMCDRCAIENDLHWQEMWNEYYSGRL